MTVSWGEIQSPTPKDWIGLYPSGSPDSGYVTWIYTTGTASGSADFTIPRSVASGNSKKKKKPSRGGGHHRR